VASPNLRDIALLADLSDAERDALARRCRWRRPAAGEEVITLGTESLELLLVVAGTLRVAYFAASGREIAYAQVEAGGHVGELGLLDGGLRSASVVAGKGCLLAVMPQALFEEMLRSYPGVARRLLVHLARLIRATDQKLTEFGLVAAVPRVYRELLRLASPSGEVEAKVAPIPTQEELASLAGTTRETVARALAQLTRTGIAERHARVLHIKSRPALEALASLPDVTVAASRT
jgi:CRP-like cAMP-binding protein